MAKKVATTKAKKTTDKNMNYHKTVGKIIEEINDTVGWSRETLARQITIQIYKNLPYNDRPEIFNPSINRTSKSDPLIGIDNFEPLHKDLSDYLGNKHVTDDYKTYPTSVFLFEDVRGNMQQRNLPRAVSEHSIDSYFIGRTAVPMMTLVAFCQLFKISLDIFMAKVNNRLHNNNNPNGLKPAFIESPLKKAFNDFCIEAFGDKKALYAYDTVKQEHLMTSLFSNGEKTITLNFVYLPMVPLKNSNGGDIPYQRGELVFNKNDGMCHVTSKLEMNSQGEYQEYEGFAIICNPNNAQTTCACFLKETNELFGLFVTFYFRLTPLDQKPPRKARLAECMSTRRSDGRPFVYRLLLTENRIEDSEMNHFAGHLKLDTRENTASGNDLCLVVTEKHIKIAEKYFSNTEPINDLERALYVDLENYFGKEKNDAYHNLIESLKELTASSTENIRIINPNIFNSKDKDTMLFLAWLRKYGIAARHDKIAETADDDVDNIHKLLYPQMYSKGESPLMDMLY